MASDQMRYLSHLVETLSTDENDRETLQKLRVKQLNETKVLSEVEQLKDTEKIQVLETCLDIIASDRKLDEPELKFLSSLRKRCNIGFWGYRKRLSKAKKLNKAKKSNKRAIISFIVIAGVLWVTYQAFLNQPAGIQDLPPKEFCTNDSIMVSILHAGQKQNQALMTNKEIFKFASKSIISVYVYLNGNMVCSGSGSVIGKDKYGINYILTNKHVIVNTITTERKANQTVRFEVKQHSGARFDAVLDFYSRKHDIAILAVKGLDTYSRPLKISLKSTLFVGQPIYAIGSPIGLEHSFTAGVISALRDYYLQTDATVHFGSSGGPLVDQHGALCGIVTLAHQTKDFNFALYADIIFAIFRERNRSIMASKNKSSK